MTPQLQQAIKLLQFSNAELASFLDEELEKNPLLEREDPDHQQRGDGAEGKAEEKDEASTAAPDSLDYADSENIPAGEDAPLDADYENLWSSNSAAEGASEAGQGPGEGPSVESLAAWGSGGRPDFSENDSRLDHALVREESLREHLSDQLAMDISDPAERVIGMHLIDTIDESGYFTGETAEIGNILGCSAEDVETVLEKMREFDPPGIFAHNLADCLALQLKDMNRLDPAIEKLLDNLDLLGKHDFTALKKLCAVDEEDFADMVAEIRALNPKPAHAFDHDVAQPITPDVIMRQAPKGGWIIELNSESLPRVLVNNQYYAKLSQNSGDKSEREYISECFNSANWLVKSLHQRATTILKVATEIVRQQDAFFMHGVQHLKPLVLRNIAEAIDMHESTVSRVTANKYMATPRGNYELKYFFTSAISGTNIGDDAHSAESVRHRIKALIDDEKAGAILSDDRIVEILKGEGIDIARRTVAKYREALRIPSSIQRRREKSSHI